MGATITGAAAEDSFGHSVALSSDGLTVAIGAPRADPGSFNAAGVVRVYSFAAGAWTKRGADIAGVAATENQGFSVALSSSGSRVALGGTGANSGTGAASVFDYNAGTSSWVQVGVSVVGDANADAFGTSVSLSDDGEWLAVGGPQNSVTDAGHARVFRLVATTWTQQGADITGQAAGDYLGHSLSLSGDGQRLVVSSPRHDTGGANAGRVLVFGFGGSTWTQVGSALDGVAAGDQFGISVDSSSAGDQIVVGARFNDLSGVNAGAASVYRLSSGTWTQKGTSVSGTSAGDNAGYAVALSSTGERIIVGSPGWSTAGADRGQARVFSYLEPTVSEPETSRGTPGIYLHIAGPISRAVQDSPIYVGSDRVAPLSAYALNIRAIGGAQQTLASGFVDARGNFGERITLLRLSPGTYMVTFTGHHATGPGLRLTSYISVTAEGTYFLIGENQPGVW
jgi:hypothetical protein